MARLVARTPLARPTDAPPIAHAPGPMVPAEAAVTGGAAPERLASADETPRHVAIIMDGNRRWARSRHLPVIEGHRRGIVALREATRAASDASRNRRILGVK